MSQKKRKKRANNGKGLGLAQSMMAARGITGLNLLTIQSAKDSGCPAFLESGRVDCDQLMKFVETMPESPDNALDIRLERAKDLRAARMLKEQKYREREKLLWPIEKIRASWARNVIACKTKLQAADNTISVDCGMRLGLSQPQIDTMRQTIGRVLRDALKELHVGEWGRVECPSCKKEITQ